MEPLIAGVDLFCGAGGLTLGLRRAGISMLAGVDLDPACEFPFTANNASKFIRADIRDISGSDLSSLYPPNSIRLLAGCAPCQPFSPFRRGVDTSKDEKWGLLVEFGRIVQELMPEVVTMENVPRLRSKSVFQDLVSNLEALGYSIDWKSVYCPRFGIPQHRRRLVLLASRLGPIHVPRGPLPPSKFRTVHEAIGSLRPVEAGGFDKKDPLHRARGVTETNLLRLRASRPGGTWQDWPEHLRAPCHRRESGKTFRSVYSRMVWDEPAPTITTEAYNFGTGRFGHPEQDRSISLREAALLQGFPVRYQFVGHGQPYVLNRLARLIGNAVPPPLAFFIGKAITRALRAQVAAR